MLLSHRVLGVLRTSDKIFTDGPERIGVKRNLITLSIVLFAWPALLAAADSGCTAKVRSLNVSIPAPAEGFVEVGNEKREYFREQAGTRLLCAFVTVGDLQRLWKPADGTDRYMLVRVGRKFEGRDVSSADFERIVAAMKSRLDTRINDVVKKTEERLRSDYKELHRREEVSISPPVSLGSFETKDTYGFGVLLSESVSGRMSKKYVTETVLIRLNKRIVYLYIYALYVDETSVKWARDVAESWARRILASNPE